MNAIVRFDHDEALQFPITIDLDNNQAIFANEEIVDLICHHLSASPYRANFQQNSELNPHGIELIRDNIIQRTFRMPFAINELSLMLQIPTSTGARIYDEEGNIIVTAEWYREDEERRARRRELQKVQKNCPKATGKLTHKPFGTL